MMDTPPQPQTYEESWSEIHGLLLEARAAGLASIGDVLAFIRAKSAVRWSTLDQLTTAVTRRLQVPTNPDGSPAAALLVANGNYALAPNALLDQTIPRMVASYVSDSTEYVIELGSGWGQNLFDISLICADRPALKYVACEPTHSGRRVTQEIASLAPRLDLTVADFNYYDARYGFLNGRPDCVVFTCHSIEQISRFPADAITRLLDRAGPCVGIHWEPLGWQRDPALVEAVRSKEFAEPIVEIADGKVLETAARWSASHGYNLDFLSVLNSLADRRLIEIKLAIYDLFGANPLNPSSLIIWEKTRAG